MLETTTIITTKSFKLAVYTKGPIEADKLVLVLPGKLDTKDYRHMHAHVDFLASKGYLALSFDPPGTWESGEDNSLYTMSNYLKAVNEVIEYYGNKQTLLLGHSRGGSMAMLAGMKNKYVTHFIAIMSHATFSPESKDQLVNEEWKEKGYRIHHRDTPSGYADENKTFKIPYSFLEDEIQYDMLKDLSKCRKPKLFIAGSRDVGAKLEMIQETYERSSEPKHFKVIDSTHRYRQHDNLINEVNGIIDDFIAKTNF